MLDNTTILLWALIGAMIVFWYVVIKITTKTVKEFTYDRHRSELHYSTCDRLRKVKRSHKQGMTKDEFNEFKDKSVFFINKCEDCHG